MAIRQNEPKEDDSSVFEIFSRLNTGGVNLTNQEIKRQYHTFFSWDGNNANQFFGLFGEDFKRRAREEIRSRSLDEAEMAFMAVGRERNRLVHQNYVEAQINDTFEEIWSKYIKACDFVELIVQLLSS